MAGPINYIYTPIPYQPSSGTDTTGISVIYKHNHHSLPNIE